MTTMSSFPVRNSSCDTYNGTEQPEVCHKMDTLATFRRLCRLITW